MHTKTILIVDDEPRIRQGIKKTLENWANGQYLILSAAGGEEAIEIIEANKISLLITDIRMPEMSGLYLLETLKKQERNPVVIIISAYSEFAYAQQALRLGVVNYLLKPVSKQKLIEAVEQAVQVEQKQTRTGLIQKVVDEKLADMNNYNDGNKIYSKSIIDAILFIDERFNMEITLKQVAAHVHLNSSYFSALFKEQTNVTFSEYLTRIRLQHAKNLLMTSTLPVTEIAEKVGYNTSKYFIKLFKQYEGMTPNAYRKGNENDF
ncbi:response regulator [Aquibacillus halophilus]|uniref:Response regulator n=1 Tax=Aquibacillus halophilus TaxID=930132 RepID=A0A6A8D837_9BACI|nr:response regulator [Aquibacillus halophilus]MRH41923.1 response regulator [Aquibacillus halophilus]